MMHGPINVKSPNNISKWQMGFNSAFKGLNNVRTTLAWDVRRLQSEDSANRTSYKKHLARCQANVTITEIF
jgi:hypothetical protein